MSKALGLNLVGAVIPREITEEMRESYLDYAMSVIVSRALPDVRDGLKPVHRRILYSMYDMGLRAGSKYRKSAAVIGEVLAKYHPHGDMAVYDAMVRMAQEFSLRYPLIDGQGNFGNIDGDSAAAYRYTEARLSPLGQELLQDIEKNTVDFTDNYDATRKEPMVLPSPLPQLLLNGTLGIAVGMATNIPPHNLLEIVQALEYMLDHPDAESEDLLTFIKGPDFPTAGIIYGGKDLAAVYAQGKGSILMRGKAEVESDEKSGRERIVITEIPYQVQKSSLLEHFAKLVEDKKIEGVKDIRDESDREGMRVVIELGRGVISQKVLNALYKFTDLQKTFNLNMLALVDGIQPRVLSLADVLRYFLAHRKQVVTRRSEFDLARAKERVHILEGLDKALDKIDEVIKTIKACKDRETAQVSLIRQFKLTELQARAILEIRLHQLAKLEREKIQSELKAKLALIKELEALLKSPKKIAATIKKELEELAQKYPEPRRTKVFAKQAQEISEQDLIPQEDTVVILTEQGFIKRVKPESYRAQKRGGKGAAGVKVGQEDVISHFLLANTHDTLFLFIENGKVFQLPVYEIPEGTRASKGKHINNFLELVPQEKILDIVAKPAGEKAKFLVMATQQGIIKKTALDELVNVRRSGLIAIKLKKGDLLKKVGVSSGDDLIIMASHLGQAVLFNEKDIRQMGRASAGIKGIRLKAGDGLISMDIVSHDDFKSQRAKVLFLTISELGYGKKSPLSDYRVQKRAGSGIKTARITKKTGPLAFAKILSPDEQELLVISRKGQVIKTALASIPKLSRATQGVRIMKLASNDKVASAVCA